jgi:ribose-phosphate pyrophosphokinase
MSSSAFFNRFARHVTARIAPISVAVGVAVAVGGNIEYSKNAAYCSNGSEKTSYIPYKAEESKFKQKINSDDGSFGHVTLDDLCLIAGHGHEKLAHDVADVIGVPIAKTTFKKFSDGELLIQLDENVRGRDVFVLQSCTAPVNESVVELLLTISCARRAGARKVIAVVPYFGYKHHRRHSQISTKHQSRILSSGAMDFAKMMQEMGVDRVIAVDLQRPGQGNEACFFDTTIPCEVLMSLELLVKHFINNVKLDPNQPIIVIAPNAESFKKARKFQLELQKRLPNKNKIKMAAFFDHSDTKTDVSDDKSLQLVGNDVNLNGANVIIVDDIIDTAGTLTSICKRLQIAGVKDVYIAASHGLFTNNAMESIENSEVLKQVVVTDSLPLNVNNNGEKFISNKVIQVGIAPMLANIIQAEYFRWGKDDEEGTHGMQDDDDE